MKELIMRDLRHAPVSVSDDGSVRLKSDSGEDQGIGEIILMV